MARLATAIAPILGTTAKLCAALGIAALLAAAPAAAFEPVDDPEVIVPEDSPEAMPDPESGLGEAPEDGPSCPAGEEPLGLLV